MSTVNTYNVFDSLMKFKSSDKFENFYTSTNATMQCYIEYVHTVGWVASYEDPTNLENCDEESFTAPSDCVRWLESKVPFKMKLQGQV
jgi:hypothetical protein